MTPQDFDQLSAYLDQQLSPAETTKLEARLGREPDLQKTLADLRLTRRMLRSLPTLKPPRNFTLTRAQAGAAARPRLQLFPALRLATALAGFAFVFLLAVDLLALRNNAAGTAAPVIESAIKSAEPTWTLDADTTSGAGGSEEATTAVPPAVSPLVAETPTPEVSIAAADLSATPTPDPDASRSALATVPTETPFETAYTLDGAIEEDATTQSTGEGYYTGTDPAPTPGWPLVRYFEIGLGLVTLLLALAAWWWRNR
jgi:hypothetical protein